MSIPVLWFDCIFRFKLDYHPVTKKPLLQVSLYDILPDSNSKFFSVVNGQLVFKSKHLMYLNIDSYHVININLNNIDFETDKHIAYSPKVESNDPEDIGCDVLVYRVNMRIYNLRDSKVIGDFEFVFRMEDVINHYEFKQYFVEFEKWNNKGKPKEVITNEEDEMELTDKAIKYLENLVARSKEIRFKTYRIEVLDDKL
jgi:hypothetical protein